MTNWNSIKKDNHNFNKIYLSTLDKQLHPVEVVNAIFSLKPYKVPGPDGIHPFFYHKYWDIVGRSVIDLCPQVFNTQILLHGIKNTFIYLIPKVPNANNLKNFRPIGLCNTIYKIITKIIANRIHPHLNKIVNPFQASFIKGRRACDNVIIIQEMCNHLKK